MTNKTEMEMALLSIVQACDSGKSLEYISQIASEAVESAAPAEDVRAVADEPSDAQILEAMRKPIYEADGGYVWDTEREMVLAAGRAVLALGRPVVMPDRLPLPPMYAGLARKYAEGWNAYADEYERVNK